MNEALRPDWRVFLGGSVAVAAVSVTSLNGWSALASTLLGALMIAGAEIDARTFLLPDIVTGGTLLTGVAFAPILYPHEPVTALVTSAFRALATASVLLLVRRCYARWRYREGLGLGDVKLAAGIGAWLPTDAIPICFGLAASSALVLILYSYGRGRPLQATTKLPFGAFLCPSLWLMFYVSVWGS